MAVIELESLPLGFRFHPTDEELVNHYLKRKIDGRISSDAVTVIPEIDVCRCEPWDLPDRSVIRSADPEWFFFSPRDRKYSNSSRQHRATEAGYWKATGKDRLIKSRRGLIGMKKTLVFYRGRAPRALRTNWIMHEYRTTEPEFDSGDQGGFVLCRLFKKPEETIPSSNTDEIESSGFSPTPTRSSPSGAHHGVDALEEFATPINQELPVTNLQENSQPLPVSADNQPACTPRWLNYKAADCSTIYSLKQEESRSNSNSNCNAASDEGACEAEVVATEVGSLLDDLSEFLGPEYEQLGSVGFPYISSPLLHTDLQFHDDLDQGSAMGLFLDADAEHESVTEFLDAVLSNPEDDFNEGVNSQKNSVNEIMQPNASSLTDSTSPLNFILNGPSQKMFSPHKLVGTRPSFDWSSCLAESPSQGNLIRIRDRQPQYLSSNDSGVPEHVAIKRLRLQRSIRLRSASTMENKSRSTNKDNCVVKVATEARERVEHQAAEEREVSDDIASTTEIKPRGLRFRRRPAGDTGTKPKGRSFDPETSRPGSTYVVGISVVLLVSLLLMCWTMVVPKLVTIR